MLPTLNPGDSVLVWRPAHCHSGDIIVVKLGNRYLIKRVARAHNGSVTLMSDNPQAGRAPYGQIRRKDIVGRVFFVRRFNEGS